MTRTLSIAGSLLVISLGLGSLSIAAATGRQQIKLVGLASIQPNNLPREGSAVGLAAEGRMAIVGGPGVLGPPGVLSMGIVGAAWVFMHDGTNWKVDGKLVGQTVDLTPRQGSGVALSADGTTAIVGGYGDEFFIGRIWAFTRDAGGTWSEQGSFRGNDYSGLPGQGWSVAVSADGNTALVGGYNDSYQGFSGVGAAWVFVRSGTVWTQQGPKLVGTGFTGSSGQGYSVALSADGNTAVVGGTYDDSGIGAAWIFTRSNGTWTQQGGKLVGTGAIGGSKQGNSVALSADGNTAIVGGPADDGNAGAAWIFVRSGGVWSQQGDKIRGTGTTGNATQGYAVALSADGNLALVGGPGDDGGIGATWLFARSNGVWTQAEPKRVGALGLGASAQGSAVALAGEGRVALIGAPGDNSGVGAAWAHRPWPCSLDVDGNGIVDPLTDGLILVRAMLGLTGSGVTTGVLGNGATRDTWDKIRTYMNDNCEPQFAP